MKALVVITDSEAVPALEKALLSAGDCGFTVLPTTAGRGRTGMKSGDRVHPGASSILFSVLPDPDVEATAALLLETVRRLGLVDSTKMYLAEVQELPVRA